jgi:drug/metabolite transporter (DMT)-like permease
MDAPLIYVTAAVGSALAYSVMDTSRKVLMKRVRALPLLALLSSGMVPAFLLWWWTSGDFTVHAGYWIPGAASVLLNVFANLAFLEAVRISPLSATIPMLSLTPVFASLLAIPLLDEVPTGRQAIGIALVVMGAFLLNLGAGDRFSVRDAWASLRRERGSMLMAWVALAWSVALPFDKLAMAEASVPFHALLLNLGVAVSSLVALSWTGRLRELRVPAGSRWVLGVSLAASVVAIGLFLLAVAHVWVGLVESLKRAIGSTGAVVIGAVGFGERVTPARLGSVALMTAGVALVLL